MIKHYLIIFCGCLLFSLAINSAQASLNLSTDYPRLANYYLRYYGHVQPTELTSLHRWDLLILPNDYQWAFPNFFDQYKYQPAFYQLQSLLLF